MEVPSQYDPFRPVDWRWERARWLREHGRYHRKVDEDPYVLAAKVYQSDEARCRNYLATEALARRRPGIHHARRIHDRPDQMERWHVEAYLLAKATPEFIADACRVPVEAVVWYEKLFFNVLPYLKHDTYIVNCVMGKAVHLGVTERDHDLLWKMLGYAMGPIFLRDWLRPVRTQRVRNSDQVSSATDAAYEQKMARKNLVAIHTMPVYNNQAVIFEAWARIKEIAKKIGGPDGESLIVNNIHAAMCAIPFTVGRAASVDLPRLAYYDEKGVELRAHEQMEVALGLETDRHRKLVDWKFPEAEAPVTPAAGGQG